MGTTDTSSTAGAVDAIKTKASSIPTTSGSGLSASVGIGGANLPDDVHSVSSALSANGLMDGPQRIADNRLYTGIIGAQERMDYALKRDGLINPGGPTEQRFQHLAGQGFVKTAEPAAMPTEATARAPGELPAPRPDASPDVARAVERKNAEARAEARHQAAVERERQERAEVKNRQQQRDLAKSQAALQASEQAEAQKRVQAAMRAPLPAEDAASNQRTADALGRFKGVGDPPRFTIDAINRHGDRAINEVADLHERVAQRDPAQARELLDLTRDGIAGARREAFDRMFQYDLKQPVTAEPSRERAAEQRPNETPAHTYARDAERPDRAPVIDTAAAAKRGQDILGEIAARHTAKAALDPTSAEDLKRRIDQAMPYDEELRLRAKSLVDAARTGNWGDSENGLAKVRALLNDPKRQAAAKATADYYARVPAEERLANMDKRGEVRGQMEDKVTAMLSNQAGIAEQKDMIARHRKSADTGDVNAKRIVQTAEADLMRRLEQHKKLSGEVGTLATEYHSIPSHPAPDVDARAGRQEDAAENRMRTRKEVAVDAALIAGGAGAGALAKRGVAGAATAASTVKSAEAAATFSRTMRTATAQAMRDSGVDFKNPSAVAEWVRANPEMLSHITAQAYGAAAAQAFAGAAAGGIAKHIPEPFDVPAEMALENSLNTIFSPGRKPRR